MGVQEEREGGTSHRNAGGPRHPQHFSPLLPPERSSRSETEARSNPPPARINDETVHS